MAHPTNDQVTPDAIRERVADSFPADLGIDPVEISDEAAVARMPVDRRHLRPGGYVHGRGRARR